MSFVPALLIRMSRPAGWDLWIWSRREAMLEVEEMSRAGKWIWVCEEVLGKERCSPRREQA